MPRHGTLHRISQGCNDSASATGEDQSMPSPSRRRSSLVLVEWPDDLSGSFVHGIGTTDDALDDDWVLDPDADVPAYGSLADLLDDLTVSRRSLLAVISDTSAPTSDRQRCWTAFSSTIQTWNPLPPENTTRGACSGMATLLGQPPKRWHRRSRGGLQIIGVVYVPYQTLAHQGYPPLVETISPHLPPLVASLLAVDLIHDTGTIVQLTLDALVPMWTVTVSLGLDSIDDSHPRRTSECSGLMTDTVGSPGVIG